MRKLTFFWLLLSIASPLFCDTPLSHDNPNLYEIISAENLKSFPNDSRRESRDFFSYAEYLQWAFEKLHELKPHEKRQSVFDLFENYERKNPCLKSEILDLTTWQDLNLLCGPRSNTTVYVGNKVARTKSEFGRVTLYHMIVNPTTDSSELVRRQALVKELVENEELFNRLNLAYDELAHAETLLLSFWHDDAFKSFAQRKEIRVPLQPTFIDELNKNTLVSECNERLDQARNAALLCCQAAAPVILPLIAYYTYKQDPETAEKYTNFAKEKLNISTESHSFSIVGLLSVWGIVTWLCSKTLAGFLIHHDPKWKKITATLNPIGGYVTGLYYSWDTVKANRIGLAALQAKLIAVAHYVSALKNFEDIFKRNPLLTEKLPATRTLEHILHELPEVSTDFKKLVDNLCTDTFKGEPSFFSSAGRILATFKIMNEQKDQLSSAFVALGEVDAYLAIAALYKEGQERKNGWCFAEYISHATEPSLEIEEFWNPLLDPDTALANTVAFNAQNNPRTLIVTGPNAGGKSTIVVKGIPLCLILAQSFGIAPAKKVRLTPFSKIITYLNIVDDIAAGNSYFKAGVLRASHILTTVSNLQPGMFGFLSVDEAFNGTNETIGQACACSFIEFLGNQPQILCATATHFPLMTRLEQRTQGKLFKNYKVSVSYNNEGRIVYPFKIEPGISSQHVAFDILREEGFEDTFLMRANQILKELNPYITS